MEVDPNADKGKSPRDAHDDDHRAREADVEAKKESGRREREEKTASDLAKFLSDRQAQEAEEAKAKALKQQEADDKEAIEREAEDTFGLTEGNGAWVTSMTGQEADTLRKWFPTLDKSTAAHMVRLMDESFLKAEESVHTALEQAIQKSCFDAITNGYHGRLEEKKTPGYAFNLNKFSRFGW
eukprot:7394541-Heterocapsa_arctica.AAC.1